MLVLHGFGHIQIDIGEVPKEFKMRTHILVGKSYVFFKEKELPDFIKRAILWKEGEHNESKWNSEVYHEKGRQEEDFEYRRCKRSLESYQWLHG